MQKIKFIPLIILIFTNLMAQNGVFAPFYAKTSYTDGFKDKSSNYGFYFQNNKFRTVVEYHDVVYKNDINTSIDNNATAIVDDFTQTNLSMAYEYDLSSFSMPLAIQYIKSSNTDYDGIYSALIGVKKEFRSFTLGANYSYSDYSNTIVENVQQISPYLIFSFGDYKSLMGTYRMKILFDSINVDSNSPWLKSNYGSYTFSLNHMKGRFQNFVQYIVGDNIFAVRGNGLSIQNFEEIYEDAYSISSKYNFTKTSSLQLSYTLKNYSDYGLNKASELRTVSAFLYFNF